MTPKKLAMAVALATASASAGAATFVADGDVIPNLATFDWGPTTVIADQGNQAFANFLNGAGSTVFDVYSHGKLSAFLDAGNNQIPSPNLAAGNYEITYEIGFSEKVKFATSDGVQSIATFGFGPNGKQAGPYNDGDKLLADGITSNFFRMYIDTAPNADPLAGTGFGNDGGTCLTCTLIMSGGVLPYGAFSSGFINTNNAPVPIGGVSSTTPASEWYVAPGDPVDTVTGSGATTTLDLLISPLCLNYNFFPNQTLTSFLVSNINQLLPFTTTDPSLSFPEGGIANAKGDVAGAGAKINGFLEQPGNAGDPWVAQNPSIIFQNDPNSPLTTVPVPEPASLALLGLGLAGIGAARRRRR